MKIKCKRKINIDLAVVASQMSGGVIYDKRLEEDMLWLAQGSHVESRPDKLGC